ncbi:hypothetical protein JMM63_03695 [Rhodovulum sulfidophilum]|nr:hypothetical protein [Rhodovulum sulfidophilum]
MSCMKLFGHKLMARGFDRQTAELQVRIAILNRFAASTSPSNNPSSNFYLTFLAND